ncbi:protein S100-G [Rhineura floridana]|uniref:protein S100-G n=1 Tax=Rhineura floridana TaxID=261503 RepID=UPI002AC8863E|nr:protein S100-G [Rhineura floridana]
MAKTSTEELRKVFSKYALKGGDPNQLSQYELKVLIEKEFPGVAKATVDAIFKEMDKNNDGEVNFEEFEPVITKLIG